MSLDYQQLCEAAVQLNTEREALIGLRKSLHSQMASISDRLIELDKAVEHNLNMQECHWPGPEATEELVPKSDVIQAFIAHPDYSQVQLGRMFNISPHNVQRTLTEFFKPIDKIQEHGQ